MPKTNVTNASYRQPVRAPGGAPGIFGPDWHKWRGATLEIVRPGEPRLLAKLESVSPGPGGPGYSNTLPARMASVTVLDEHLKPIGIIELPWPPAGRVRVVRAP